MALSVEGPADRVEQLITLTERLTELMAQDAADFEARRPHLAAARAEENSRLANLYRHESMRVKRNPDLIAGAPAARRQHLTQATEAMERVLRRHAGALEAMKTVTEGLVKAVADEVAGQRATSSSYGPGAKATTPGASIALNRRA